MDRGGLWYATEMFNDLIIRAEKIFSYEIASRPEVRRIDHQGIISTMMNNSEIKTLFQEHVVLCDISISSSTIKDTLYSILHLFVKIRAYNFAKDLVQKQKFRNDDSSKKPLRKDLKNSSDQPASS